MAPVQQRRIPIVPKDRFSSLFGALKTQAYYEYSRPTQHTYVRFSMILEMSLEVSFQAIKFHTTF